MSLHRRNPKRDAAEPAVVDRLEQLGCSVERLSGNKIPDLLGGWRGLTRLVEVKSDKRPKKRDEHQREWARQWRGSPIAIVTDPEDATSWLLSLAPHAVRIEAAKKRHEVTTQELEDA